ncbi:hypothetical protein KDL44_15060 [bacterium]|nr:hypothetical protein [bacterium]
MRGVCLLLLPLILLISLAGCGVFDNPLHLPEWGAEPPAFDLPGAAADEQGAEQPGGNGGDDTATEDDSSDQQAG